MSLRELYQRMERDRKKQKYEIIGWIGFIIFIVLQFFSFIFWCYVLWWLILISFFVILGIFALFKKVQNPNSRLKVFLVRLFLIVISVSVLYVFIVFGGVHKYFLDIPDYFSEN